MKRIATRAAITVLALSAIASAQPAPPSATLPPAPPPETPPETPPTPPETPPPPPTTAPEAQPPQYPPQPYPYPYGYPPPGYGYPPPGYGYPPPGYAYPPPGMESPPRPKKPRYPDDAAVQTSPFVDVTIGGINMEERVQHFLVIGVQAGMYLGGLVRVAPQLGLFASEPEDDFTNNFDESSSLPDGFQAEPSDSAAILWGGSVGFAVLSRSNFVLSPGVLFLRTDEQAYGSFVAIHAPFEWVTNDGARVGFAVGVGRSFGGSVRATCFDSGFNSPSCDPGEKREFDREAGAGFYAHFEIGWGFNHPEPLPSEPAPAR